MLSKVAPLVYLLMKHISVVTYDSGVVMRSRNRSNYVLIYKMFHFQGIERYRYIMIRSNNVKMYLAPLVYQWYLPG